MNDEFPSPDLRQMAFTPHEIMTDFGGPGGASSGVLTHGFIVGDMYGHRLIGHAGRVDRYSSLNFHFPDDQNPVILLGNQRNRPVTSSPVIECVFRVFAPAD